MGSHDGARGLQKRPRPSRSGNCDRESADAWASRDEPEAADAPARSLLPAPTSRTQGGATWRAMQAWRPRSPGPQRHAQRSPHWASLDGPDELPGVWPPPPPRLRIPLISKAAGLPLGLAGSHDPIKAATGSVRLAEGATPPRVSVALGPCGQDACDSPGELRCSCSLCWWGHRAFTLEGMAKARGIATHPSS